MHRFDHIDLCSTMEQIAGLHTEHYLSDVGVRLQSLKNIRKPRAVSPSTHAKEIVL